MEELQLALTSARIEQKNFGLWLKSWQVGQMLQALVTDKFPSGQLVLRVGGHQITATADIPVQKGAVLNLEVSRLEPAPTLKIINGPVPNSATPSNVRGELQLFLPQLLPQQGRVVDPLLTLLNPLQGANILSLLGLKKTDVERLLRQIPRADQLIDPKQLKIALEKSGVFLESQLNQLLASGGALPPGDLKAELLRLLYKVQRKLKEGHIVNDQEAQDSLLLLKRTLEGAIARITLCQLAVCQPNEAGQTVWSFEIPFQYKGEMTSLSLSIQRDDSSSEEPQDQQNWKARLSLDVVKLGPVEAEIFLRGQKISVVFFSEQSGAAKAIEQQMEQLQLGLESRGLEVSVLLSREGQLVPEQFGAELQKRGFPRDDLHKSGPQNCVDERI